MTHGQFLRIKKLTGVSIISVAARHNLREIVAELGAKAGGRIDPLRTSMNSILRGQSISTEVARLAQSLIENAGIKKLRKDAVRALEAVFSLPPHFAISRQTFFEDCVEWVEQHFQAPIISAVLHLDEATPHCHVLILPLVKGRMIGSDLMGSRATLQAMHTSFHENVGRRYGLHRQAVPKRASAAVRRTAAKAVLNELQANPELLRKQDVAESLNEAIAADPEPLLIALGLPMPSTKVKSNTTFAAIMTKPCRPDGTQKSIGFGRTNPIGFAPVVAGAETRTLSCVGFASKSVSDRIDVTVQICDSGDGPLHKHEMKN